MDEKQELSVGQIIQLFTPLAHGWPGNLSLFSHRDRLYLINANTGRVYWSTLLIKVDSSPDATITLDHKGGEFIE